MQNKTSTPANPAPNVFVAKHQKDVMGILHGFDRLRLRGTLRELYCPKVMEAYLSAQRLLLKHFGTLVKDITQQVKEATQAITQKLSRPLVYVNSSARSKEDLAKEIARRDGVT